MYKRIDFTQLEGFPITQNTLALLQESYRDAFSGLSLLIGDNVIITGVADLGANYGDGWVSINGELLPFVGGVKAAQIVIEQTAISKEFADSSNKDVWFTRVAKCGVSGGTAIGAFARLSTLRQMLSDVTGKVNKSGDTMTGNLIVPNATANNHAVNYGQLLSVINGAPGALDTLYELATALGNDANFSTTVFNLINGKVSKAGDTMTGNLTVPNAVSAGHALNKGQADSTYIRYNPVPVNPGNDANSFIPGSIQDTQASDINTPTAESYIIITTGGILVRQIAFQTNGANVGRMYIRTRNVSSVWSAWVANNV